jgi:predicted nucleotidyltransferase
LRRIALFGSVGRRGEAGPDSDVDLLVEFIRAKTFRSFMALSFLLERSLSALWIS